MQSHPWFDVFSDCFVSFVLLKPLPKFDEDLMIGVQFQNAPLSRSATSALL